jgi:hypothetical protein
MFKETCYLHLLVKVSREGSVQDRQAGGATDTQKGEKKLNVVS